MTIAFLFPGQGSQRPGMLHALPDHPRVHATLDEAADLLHQDPLRLDEESALESTIATQLAIFLAGIACARALLAEGVQPAAVAGLSVGAFAAAVVSGAIEFAQALPLVRRRAELTAQRFPSGYGLSAIVGLSEQQVAKLVAAVNAPGRPVYSALLNAPHQIVIAGSIDAMEVVLAQARANGSTKAERLPVRIPSHCPLFADVAAELADAMSTLPAHPAQLTYITNRGARPTRSFDRIREDIATNIAHPVRWHDSTEVLAETGTRLFLEMHPGQVLTSLASAAFPHLRAVALAATTLPHAAQLAKAQQQKEA